VTVPHLMLVAVALSTMLGMILLYRSRSSLPALPQWGWRNIIALIALYASVAGAAIITALIWSMIDNLGEDADRLINELVRDPKAARVEIGEALNTIYHSIANNLLALTLGLLAILIGFGFAITARRFQGEFLGGKFDMSGGEDEVNEAAEHVVEGAKQAAQEVKEG